MARHTQQPKKSRLKGGKHKQKAKTGYIPNRGYCPRFGKRIYREHEARKIARTLSRNTSERVVEYVCSHCNGWHVGHDTI